MPNYTTLFKHPASLSGIYLKELLAAYEKSGPDLSELLQQHFINRDRLNGDPRYRIPLFHAFSLLDQVAKQENDPFITLKMVGKIRPRAFQYMGYAVTSCPTLREAALTLARYEQLVWDAGQITLDESEEMACLRWEKRVPVPDIVVETAIAGWLQIGKKISPIRQPVTKVTFQHQPVGPLNVYTEMYQCEVEFNSLHNALYFPKNWLDLHPIDEDPVLQRWVIEKAGALLKDYQLDVNIESELRAWMLNHMDDPDLSLDTAAQFFGISARQLRHQISPCNINFRSLLDQTRHEMALHQMGMLNQGQPNTFTDVALSCGFSEQSAFNRAFKRWTGQTPSDYVQQKATTAHESPL